MEFFGKIVAAGLMNGSIYGLVAVGFVLIYKSSSVLNFSQGYMLLLGAYIFWSFRAALRLDLLLSLLLTLPTAFLMGIMIERLTLRPLIGQSLLSMITVTIFLSLVLEGLVSLFWGTYPLQQVTIFPKGSLKLGKTIFHKSWRTLFFPLTRYRYPQEPLEKALREQLGDMKMKDLWANLSLIDVVITTFDVLTNKTLFIKPWKLQYQDWSLVKALRAGEVRTGARGTGGRMVTEREALQSLQLRAASRARTCQ